MPCAACGHHLADDARFCSQCGSPVTGQAHDEAGDLARYVPEELLRRIRSARAGGAMRGERRTVTMLFADIQGSTAAAEQLDPEDWAEIVNGAFAHLIAPVYRYEGTLARLSGDAILAFFGAPIAHEDDPVRAVRAALDTVEAFEEYAADLLARTGSPIGVRVGINTGLVVVGEVGSDLRVEYTALGDAINIAARMEQTAEAGTVRVTAYTADLLGGQFDLRDIGPVDVKGKAEPVRALQVLGRATAAPSARTTARLIGRADEQAALRALLGDLLQGSGGIAALVGEAGIGKSRLVVGLRGEAETRTVVASRAEVDGELAWLEGRSRSYDGAVPYATFSELLRRWWDLQGTAPDRVWEQVAIAVQRARGVPDPDAATLLTALVGGALPTEHAQVVAELAAPVLHERTVQAVADYLQAEAARRPVLVVLDDLHWTDALSLALAERVLHLTGTAPLAVLLAMRPDRDASWRLVELAQGEAAARARVLELTPLPDASTRELLEELLGGKPADALGRRVLDHANGNPLFVEELVRAMAARDGAAQADDHVDVPATLGGLLAARLDQLEETARLVAQVASVIGREFGVRPLTALVDHGVETQPAVAALVRDGIFVEARSGEEARYAFRHALIQETAYSTVLLRTRRELHARLAAHLEEEQPDAVQDLARHHLAAGASDRAFPYLVEAGSRATRTMALGDAIKLFVTALDAVPAEADPDAVVRAHDGLGEAYSLIPDLPHATATYQRLLDYGRSAERPSIQVTALNRLGFTTGVFEGDFPRAEDYLAQARRIAEEAGDDLGLADYHINACVLASLQGSVERALEHDEQTARLGAAQGDAGIRLLGLMRRALNLVLLTQYEAAEGAVADAIAAAREVGAAEKLAALRAFGDGFFALRDGDLARAHAIVLAQLPTLDRYASFQGPLAHGLASGLSLDLGDPEGALAHGSAALRAAQAQGQPFAEGLAAAHLADAYAVCGLTQPLEELRAAALASLSGPMGEFQASSVWSHLGWAELAGGRHGQAGQDFTIGIEVSSATRYWERPRMLIGSAFATLGLGDPGRAGLLLAEAAAYVAERGIRTHDALLGWGSGLVALATGDSAGAREQLQRAAAIAAATGRRLVQRDVAVARAQVGRDARESAVHLASARDLTAQVAGSIADDRLRAAFLARSESLLGQPTGA